MSTKKLYPCIRCHNSGKQHRPLTKFYANTEALNCKQVTKFQQNRSTSATSTASLVRSLKSISVHYRLRCDWLSSVRPCEWQDFSIPSLSSRFLLPGQQGLVWHNHFTLKLWKPPIWCKTLGDVSYTKFDFVSKWHQLVVVATRVGLTEIWMIPFDCLTPKTAFSAHIWHLPLTVPLQSCHRP